MAILKVKAAANGMFMVTPSNYTKLKAYTSREMCFTCLR